MFTLYHSSIKFSPVFPTILIPSIILPDTNSRVLFFPVIPPSKIACISFDSVINSFASIVLTQEYNTLKHSIYESNSLCFSITTSISPNASIFTTLSSNNFPNRFYRIVLFSNSDLPNSVFPNSDQHNRVLPDSLLSNSMFTK